MRRNTEIQAELRWANETVAIMRHGGDCSTAGILAIEDNGDGGHTIYLDRLVHAPWEEAIGEFSCSGAVTTILNGKGVIPCITTKLNSIASGNASS